MKPDWRKKIIPSFLLFFLLSFALILLDEGGALSGPKGAFENLIVPAKARIYHLRQSQISHSEIEKIIGEKERKIASLEGQVSTLKTENAAMKRLLGTPLPSSWRFLPAQVIGEANTQTLQIDKGKGDGVREGMAVVFENALVGKASKVGEHFSEILLPSAPSSRILALTRSSGSSDSPEETKAKGILIGQGDRMNFERVTLKENLAPGDFLFTSGDEFLPSNLFLGKIAKVYKKEGDIFQKAEVEPAVQSDTLETVFVLTYSL